MSSVQKSTDLGWGQRYIWLRHHQLPPAARHEAHIVTTFDLPAGVAMSKVQATLNYLVRRHEALRTTYHADVDGDPQQRVHPPSAVPLTVVGLERDGGPAPAEVVERLSMTEFDLAREWPLRACVITSGGRPRQLILVLNHMAFDAWTVDRFERELEALGAGITTGRPAVLEPVRFQPGDLVRYESSAAAVAAKDRAMAYWRDEVATVPADPFGRRRRHDVQRVARSATLTSPALLAGSRAVARRHGVWPSVVHLATYAALMAAYTGAERVTHLSFNGNRDSNAYTDVMTCMFSPLLMRMECPGDPAFRTLLAETATRFERARGNSYVPYDELVELLARESHRRGRAVRVGAELNFLSQSSHASRARRTRFSWNPAPVAWERYGSDTYLRVYELQDAVVLSLHAVSTVMDAEAMECFLRGYEAVLLAHVDPAVDLRIGQLARLAGFGTPPPAGREADLGRRGTVDLDAVESLLGSHPAVLAVRVSVQDGDVLTADVVAGPSVGPVELRAHALGQLDDRPAAACPDWFRVHRRTGAGPDPWDAVVLTDQGDGHPAEPATLTDTERVLAEAIGRANGLARVSLDDSYTVAGGRVLRIPRVLSLLAEQGWAGVGVDRLAGGRPLRALARSMTRTAVPTGSPG